MKRPFALRKTKKWKTADRIYEEQLEKIDQDYRQEIAPYLEEIFRAEKKREERIGYACEAFNKNAYPKWWGTGDPRQKQDAS